MSRSCASTLYTLRRAALLPLPSCTELASTLATLNCESCQMASPPSDVRL